MSDSPRILFYVQHLLGIGHQMRAAALTRAMQAAGLEVHYVSGGFEEHAVDLGGARQHQLPPVRAADSSFSGLVDVRGQPVDESWWQRRAAALMACYDDIRPALLLIEGFPFARRKFARELLPLLERARGDGVKVAGSLRDILVPPSTPEKTAKAMAIAERFFDRFLVHGDPDFVPLSASLPDVDRLEDRLSYTGYVRPNAVPPAPSGARRGVLVSAGGGAVGGRLMRLAMEARGLSRLADEPWHFLMGPNLPPEDRDWLQARAGEDVLVEPVRPDFPKLLGRARLSISQGGYNTVMDLLDAGTPAVIVPFADGGESEQTMRAELLQKAGRLTMLAEDGLNAEGLASAINNVPADLPPGLAQPDMRGAATSARLIREMIGERVA